MYFTGQGLAPDYIRAHMWLNLADSRLPAMDAKYRGAARQIRDHVARLLSPEALARAQRMAREWRPRAEAGSASPAPRTAEGGDNMQARIAAAQRALVRLGYDPGPADGVLGPKTRAAFRAFQADAASEREPARLALERASTGSGFRVSTAGHILTNEHVVRECAELRVPLAGVVAVAARDEAADLALLAGAAGGAVAAFRQGRGRRGGGLPAARRAGFGGECGRWKRRRPRRPRRRPAADPDHRAGAAGEQRRAGAGFVRQCGRRGGVETGRHRHGAGDR